MFLGLRLQKLSTLIKKCIEKHSATRKKMTRYKALTEKLSTANRFGEFSSVNQSKLQKIQETYTNVPDDYIDFLREIGFGSLNDYSFMIYDGLISVSEVYSLQTADAFKNILLFGDDFAGCSFGFDTSSSWSLIEIDSVDLSIYPLGKSFEDFITNKIT